MTSTKQGECRAQEYQPGDLPFPNLFHNPSNATVSAPSRCRGSLAMLASLGSEESEGISFDVPVLGDSGMAFGLARARIRIRRLDRAVKEHTGPQRRSHPPTENRSSTEIANGRADAQCPTLTGDRTSTNKKKVILNRRARSGVCGLQTDRHSGTYLYACIGV